MQHLRRPGEPGPLSRGRGRRLRRLLVLAVAIALVATAGGVLVRYVAGPHYRPPLRTGEAYAIDVSNHQGTIDWAAVAADGIPYAYLKASEGRGYVDAYFAANWSQTAQAGVRRGAYHFFTLCAAGREQAENFLRVAPPEPAALPPALDLELLGGCPERPTTVEVDQQLTEFVSEVERAWGRELVLYARSSWTDRYPLPTSLSSRPRWRTSFVVRPDADWAIWQVHYIARIDGIAGGVDLDVVDADRL